MIVLEGFVTLGKLTPTGSISSSTSVSVSSSVSVVAESPSVIAGVEDSAPDSGTGTGAAVSTALLGPATPLLALDREVIGMRLAIGFFWP
jgi:hypothetical protein